MNKKLCVVFLIAVLCAALTLPALAADGAGRSDGMFAAGTAASRPIIPTPLPDPLPPIAPSDSAPQTPAPYEVPPQAARFSDVDSGKWYAAAVEYVAANGVMNGGDGAFAPDTRLNRAMLVQILYNLEKRPAVSENAGYSDVPADRWFAAAVAWASARHIAEGYEGRFFPESDITREQLVTILWRYEQGKGRPMTGTDSLAGFRDAELVSAYARAAMAWAIDAGVMRGNGDGTLNPRGTATRAEIAQIMMNYLQK